MRKQWISALALLALGGSGWAAAQQAMPQPQPMPARPTPRMPIPTSALLPGSRAAARG